MKHIWQDIACVCHLDQMKPMHNLDLQHEMSWAIILAAHCNSKDDECFMCAEYQRHALASHEVGHQQPFPVL